MVKSSQYFLLYYFISLISACSPPLSEEGVDVAFMNGGIYLSNESHAWAEAIGVHDGVIVMVGSNNDIKELIGSKTNVIDLQDKMLLPSFHDGHAHVEYGGRDKIGCSINGRS